MEFYGIRAGPTLKIGVSFDTCKIIKIKSVSLRQGVTLVVLVKVYRFDIH